MPKLSTPPARKRVAIIGAGAAGMSAAYALSLSPDEFEVCVFERHDCCGGMATSVELDESIYGASWFNAGVQGASPVFFNVFKIWGMLGFQSGDVGMEVSFGKGKEDAWSNVFPSVAIDRFQDDIVKFGRVLKIIKYAEVVFFAISVETLLSMFRFSKDFGEVIVYPLVALFFGTGNQTPFISSAILARVFNDDNMRLFEFSPKSFLASIPPMKAFPRLSLIYSTWAEKIQSTGNVTIKTSTEVTSIERNPRDLKSSGGGVRIRYRATEGVGLDQMVVGAASEIEVGVWDEVIMCCDADASLKLLGEDATYLEKKILGNVKYLWDITVTHSDTEYMKKYYNLEYDESMASTKRGDDKEAQSQFEYARTKFQPLYFIRSYPNDKKKIEMSFDLSHYQPQFLETSASDSDSSLDKKKTYKHLYQTIFLDREGAEHLWTRNEIKKEEIVREEWWKQQSHRVNHYRGTVPFMLFINGRNRTQFAGAWTVLNMHEIAVVSGFSAAYRLGAKYPYADDAKCKRLFSLYMLLSQGKRMRSEDRTGFLS